MTLFEKLHDLICIGYEVSFKREIFQFIISIKTVHNNEEIIDESQMPLQDHFTENRIIDCINFQVNRIDEKIENIKLKRHCNHCGSEWIGENRCPECIN